MQRFCARRGGVLGRADSANHLSMRSFEPRESTLRYQSQPKTSLGDNMDMSLIPPALGIVGLITAFVIFTAMMRYPVMEGSASSR